MREPQRRAYPFPLALRRPSRGLGRLLLAGFHRGSETIHRDEFFGRQVDLDFRLFEPVQIAAALDEAGLAIEQIV